MSESQRCRAYYEYKKSSERRANISKQAPDPVRGNYAAAIGQRRGGA
ncbi:MAG: hypothetical protein ACYTEX_23725 [Planctomycetota bacterium]